MGKVKLSQLEILVAAVDTGSFSAAAAELDCTQSRISHAIAELEQNLGARLLHRSRSGCLPTDAGTRVLLKARQILRLTDGLGATAANQDGVRGTVRLACFRSVGTHVLPHVLAALATAFPGIEIELIDDCQTAEAVARTVLEARADIGIGCLPVAEALVAQPIFQDNYVLLVPSAIGLPARISWAQLEGLAFIQPLNERASWVLTQCQRDGLNMQPSHRLVSDSSIMAMVALGSGFSIFPRLASFPAPTGVSIVDLPLSLTRQFAVLRRAETMQAKAMQTVIRFLRDKNIVQRTSAYQSGVIQFA